ncbi:MAG: helix-turn-helix transcriptional regulator [Methanocella sp.]
MPPAGKSVLWSLALFFGWLLSFPLHGPLLGALAAGPGEFNRLSLVFVLSHAFGLLSAGFLLPKHAWRLAMQAGASVSLALSLVFPFAPAPLRDIGLVALGLSSAIFVIGWSQPYTVEVRTGRTGFMAVLILVSNLILYGLVLLSGRVPAALLWGAADLSLAGALWCTHRLLAEFAEAPVPAPPPRLPVGLMAPVGLLIFGLCLNGGFLYTVVLPHFASFAALDRVFGLLPYLAGVAALGWLRPGMSRQSLIYLGVCLMGLGFVAFAAMGHSLPVYLLTDTLILASFALVDVFLWSLLGEIAEVYGRPHLVFGFGLSLNVLGLFVGGVLGERASLAGLSPTASTGLLAAATLFAVLLLAPTTLDRMERDLAGRIRTAQEASVREGSDPPERSLARWLPGADLLTYREQEIVDLIVGGCDNPGIAARLHISENTVKVHIKNLNRKLGISSKHELLAILLQVYAGSREAAATSIPEA